MRTSRSSRLLGLGERDRYGDRAEINELPEHSALWTKLDARTEACLGTTCPDWEGCFVTAMRRKALESDIVIVNHHLFFADLSIKQQAATRPMRASCPRQRWSSSTRRMSWRRSPPATSVSG